MPGHDEAVGGHGGEDEHVGAEEADQHVVAPLRPRDHAGVELLENFEHVVAQLGFTPEIEELYAGTLLQYIILLD